MRNETYNRYSKASGNNYKRDYCEQVIDRFTAEIEQADNNDDVMTATALRAERREVEMYVARNW